MKNNNKIKMLNIRMNLNLIESFKKHCNNNGYSISKRIRLLIENDINNEKNIK